MSRGRKSFSSNITDNWEKAFFNSIGYYITSINKGLSKTFKNEPLKQHIKIVGGYAFKNAEYKTTGIPIIRISDFNNEKVTLESVVYYDESKDLEKYVLNESDIIIALTGGTIGKLGIVQAGLGKLYLNQRVGKFEVLHPEEFEKEYIYWIARGVEGIVKTLAWGAAIPNVSPKQIEELLFPIPTKEIQNSIISFLNDLKDNTLINGKEYFDIKTEIEIISIQNKQVKVLEINNELSDQLTQISNLNQAILQEAVQGKLVKQDKKDEPATELLKRIKAEKAKSGKKEKPLPPIKPEEIPLDIPENWVWAKLNEICDNITDGTHQTPTYFKSGYIFLSSKNVTSGKIDWNEIKYIDEKQHLEMHKRVAPRLNDILLAKNGTTGVAALVDRDVTFDIYVSLALLRPLVGIYPNYLLHFVNSSTAKLQFNKRLRGIGVPNLHLNEIREVLIPIPPFEEQKRIVVEIENQLAKTKQLKEHIIANQHATEQLLKALLHQAFEVEESVGV